MGITIEIPFHGCFNIPVRPGIVLHTEGFRNADGSTEAHSLASGVEKGMAVTGLRVLGDDAFARKAKDDIEQDKKLG